MVIQMDDYIYDCFGFYDYDRALLLTLYDPFCDELVRIIQLFS